MNVKVLDQQTSRLVVPVDAPDMPPVSRAMVAAFKSLADADAKVLEHAGAIIQFSAVEGNEKQVAVECQLLLPESLSETFAMIALEQLTDAVQQAVETLLILTVKKAQAQTAEGDDWRNEFRKLLPRDDVADPDFLDLFVTAMVMQGKLSPPGRPPH